MSINLENKVVIITGASSGIGKATALAFAKENASVVLAARREDRLQELVNEIQNTGGKALVVKTDISKAEEVENLIQKTLNKFGRIDILINNAGFGVIALVEETSIQDMRDIVDTNLMGPFYTMRLAIPLMKKQGYGHIINISSVIGRIGTRWNSAYCATKFGLIGLTESALVESIGTPIHVSTICPGLTDTEIGLVKRDPKNHIQNNIWAHGVSAEKVARKIVHCAKYPKSEVYISWKERFLIFINSLSPALILQLRIFLYHYRNKRA